MMKRPPKDKMIHEAKHVKKVRGLPAWLRGVRSSAPPLANPSKLSFEGKDE